MKIGNLLLRKDIELLEKYILKKYVVIVWYVFVSGTALGAHAIDRHQIGIGSTLHWTQHGNVTCLGKNKFCTFL